jgi:hypothetical protein
MSSQAEDLLFDENVWTSAGAFLAAAPYCYAAQIPLGLQQAYGKLNQPALARQFGGLRVNFYNGDGTLAWEAASLNPADSLVFDTDVLACATDFTGFASPVATLGLFNYAETVIAEGDYAYRHDDRTTARSSYVDVRCAAEKFFPSFAEEADLALTGVLFTIQSINNRTFAGVPADRQLQKLTTLDVVIVENDVPHRVMEGTFLPIRTAADSSIRNLSAIQQNLASYFEFHVEVDLDPDTGNTSQSSDDVPEVEVDSDTSGIPTHHAGDTIVYTEHDLNWPSVDQIYQLYLYCVAKIEAIDVGLNWYGYPPEHVHPWEFEHLYGIARDLCNRALEAEQRVFSLLPLYETAAEQEFLAAQQAELAGAQMTVVEAQVVQQVASNNVAMAQAELTLQQAAAQAKKSGTWANVAIVTTAVAAAFAEGAAVYFSGGTALPIIAAVTPAVAGGIVGVAGNVSGHTQDVKVLNEALEVTRVTFISSMAALSVAIAERDVAALQVEQASAYVDFLVDKDLNSDAYLYLLGLAKQVSETYLYHANRMAWLAECALEHETRQAYDLIKLDYMIDNELADMTRAQQITGDLESLRSEYVAGQTLRLQEIKWTIALSQIDPIAWQDLRETGTCTFLLRQRDVGRTIIAKKDLHKIPFYICHSRRPRLDSGV